MVNASGFVEEKSVDPRARRDSSSEPALSIFFRISSKPPLLASDFVVIGWLTPVASPGEGFSLASFHNFFSAASRMCFCPMLSPSFSKSVTVRSCRASSISRSSFLRISTLVHQVSKLKLAIIIRTDKKSLQSCSTHQLARSA